MTHTFFTLNPFGHNFPNRHWQNVEVLLYTSKTFTLEVGGQRNAHASLPLKRTSVHLVQEAVWISERVSMGPKKLAPTRLWTPDRPTHIESLYRLRYHGRSWPINPRQNKNFQVPVFLKYSTLFMLEYVTVAKFWTLFLWFVFSYLSDIFHGLVRTQIIHIHFLIVDTSKEDIIW